MVDNSCARIVAAFIEHPLPQSGSTIIHRQNNTERNLKLFLIFLKLKYTAVLKLLAHSLSLPNSIYARLKKKKKSYKKDKKIS